MDVEIKEKENRRHVGRNLQRIRVYLGMKQEALAADLGVNQQVISKIEKQEEIEEGFLKRIAESSSDYFICFFRISILSCSLFNKRSYNSTIFSSGFIC